jgi:hypothetical protein
MCKLPTIWAEQQITAISNQGVSNVPVTTWKINATETKDRVMSDVSSVAEITLRTIRDVLSIRVCKRKHTHISVRKFILSHNN